MWTRRRRKEGRDTRRKERGPVILHTMGDMCVMTYILTYMVMCMFYIIFMFMVMLFTFYVATVTTITTITTITTMLSCC